jgi:hypothetical protein
MKLFHPTKITIRLYMCFVMAFTVMPRVVVAAPVFDATFIVELKLLEIQVNNAKDGFISILNKLDNLLLSAISYHDTIKNIENTVIADVESNTKWVEENKPNGLYQTRLQSLTNKLNQEKLISSKEFSDIEKDFFTNDNALKNMSKVYGKNNSKYETILEQDKPLCPPPVLSNIPNKQGVPNASYTKLQNLSCQAIYNAIAYKEKVNSTLVETHKTIDEATNNTLNGIIKLPSKTIGDYNARQTALETIRLYRKIAVNDSDTRVHNAETEIEIAQNIRKYAANAILTGPPKSANVENRISFAKAALSLAIGTLTSKTAPYNQ